MDTNKKWIVIVVVITLLVLGFIIWGMKSDSSGENLATSTSFDQSIEDQVIKVSFSSSDFGLATNPSQILVETQVSPCDLTLEIGFDYCLYYKGTDLDGTDFESAGMRIKKRDDLLTENSCLNTPPRGYDANLSPNTLKPQAEVSTSVFEDIVHSGEDYQSTGSIYRLFHKDSKNCYEFETKIVHMGEDGDTESEQAALNKAFDEILTRVIVANDYGDVFP